MNAFCSPLKLLAVAVATFLLFSCNSVPSKAKNPKGFPIPYVMRFMANSSEILPEEETRIAEISRTLAEADENVVFLVEGHAASIKRPKYELQLSIERAKAIARHLEAAGIAKERIIIKGYGSTRPVARNNTDEKRAQNSRVEITALSQAESQDYQLEDQDYQLEDQDYQLESQDYQAEDQDHQMEDQDHQVESQRTRFSFRQKRLRGILWRQSLQQRELQ